MKVIGIIGSPHKNGNTAQLMNELMDLLRPIFETEIIFLKDFDIKPCEGCHICKKKETCIIKDDMQKIYPKIKGSDIIILSSPSYMGGVTSRLKIFMERTWHLRSGQLENKIGTYIVVGRRKIGSVINEIDEYFSRLRVIKIPGVLGFAYEKDEIFKDQEALRDLQIVGKQIIFWAKNISK
ncbi:MAG: flavodoxin family protein [Candidatus Helarchaeota archaeon]